jgi:hypothetical protein
MSINHFFHWENVTNLTYPVPKWISLMVIANIYLESLDISLVYVNMSILINPDLVLASFHCGNKQLKAYYK